MTEKRAETCHMLGGGVVSKIEKDRIRTLCKTAKGWGIPLSEVKGLPPAADSIPSTAQLDDLRRFFTAISLAASTRERILDPFPEN